MDTWQTRAKNAMKGRGLTQDALAERLDVTQGAVQHWLSGTRKPDLDLLLAISAAIGVSPAWLLLGLDESSQLAGLPTWAAEPLARVIKGTRAGHMDAEWFARFELALQLVGLPADGNTSDLVSTPEVHAKARAQRSKTTNT